MQLTDEQKAKVRQWVAEGCGLSEIQKRLRDECGLTLTFMDVRFLVLDLGIALKEKEPPKPLRDLKLEKPPAKETALPDEDAALPEEEEPLEGEALAPGEGPPPGTKVTVEIDRVLKPGALVSGSVRFSDGTSASWALDQFGRLGLNVGQKGYRPSPADLQAFQQELTRLIQSRGM